MEKLHKQQYRNRKTGEIVSAIQWNGQVDYELCSLINGAKNLFMDASPYGGTDVMIRCCRNASYLVEGYYIVRHGEDDFSEYKKEEFDNLYELI